MTFFQRVLIVANLGIALVLMTAPVAAKQVAAPVAAKKSIRLAVKPLRIVTFQIPLMVETSEKGLFVDLTKEIAKRNNLEIKIEMLPTAKSILAFSSGQADCIFPALDSNMPKGSLLSSTFYEKLNLVFYPKGHGVSEIAELEGKKVGLTFRYTYPKDLIEDKKILFEYADSDVLNLQKLAQGSIDAFIAEERSGLQALIASGASNIEYKRKSFWPKQQVFYAFQETEEGQRLMEIFSNTLTQMSINGDLDRILLNHQPKPSL